MKTYASALLIAVWAAPAFAERATDYVTGCSTGDTEACLRGSQLAQAEGDIPLLVTFAQQGCALGELISCSDEGMLVIAGQSDHIALSQAVLLVQQGCDGGYARACTNMGYLLYTGTGVQQDTDAAAQFYQIGCDGGSGTGCMNLARMVYAGEVDATTAPDVIDLLNRACDLGEVSACL